LDETVRGLTVLADSSDSSNRLHRLRTQGSGSEIRNPVDKWQKLMMMFEGDDAYGWKSRVERYFDLKGVTEQEKIFRLLWWPWKAKSSHGISGISQEVPTLDAPKPV
jgi:hypothetical protein